MDCHDVDHISSLPNDVICNILCRLPTIDAMATSLLLKDLKYQRTPFYNGIDIDDRDRSTRWNTEVGVAMFVNFMEKVLRHGKDSRRVHLHFSYDYGLNLLASWIWTLLSNNESLETLHIDSLTDGFEIDYGILNRRSLEEFFLKVSIFRVPSVTYFPKLTSLFLGNVKIVGPPDTTVSPLLLRYTRVMEFNFPVLKELTLAECQWHATTVQFHAPALKIFKSYTVLDPSDLYHHIYITGARLAAFHSRHSLEDFHLVGSNVVSAALENFDDCLGILQNGRRVRRLLNFFSPTIEDLKMHYFLVEAIMGTKHEFLSLPICEKLERLVLCSDSLCPVLTPDALFELLHSTPFLKTLVIHIQMCVVSGFEEVDMVVPSCIESSLEEVEFKTKYFESLRVLAEYLLKNGSKLKRFHYETPDDSGQILEELSALRDTPDDSISTHVTITI